MHQTPTGATLRIVTMPAEPEPVPCEGTYTCGCQGCIRDRANRVARGVRPTPKPLKRAA